MKPSDFLTDPMDSVLQNAESETVARNIMAILKRTGNEFRRLTWDEYETERRKDGNFTSAEKKYFDRVVPYTVSADFAKSFSPVWGGVRSETENRERYNI